MSEPEPPRPACEVCERVPGPSVQDALTRALLIDRPAAGATVAAHEWTMTVADAGGGGVTLRCPEHAR